MDLTSECRGDRATFSMIVHGLQNLRRMQILQSRADERDSMFGGSLVVNPAHKSHDEKKERTDNPNPNPSKYHRATKAANPFLSVSAMSIETCVALSRRARLPFHACVPVISISPRFGQFTTIVPCRSVTGQNTNDPGLQNLREIEILHYRQIW